MNVQIIQKYQKYSVAQLLKMATKHFNKFIRERDREGDYFFCPTCRKMKRIEGSNYHACHLFPAGHYPALRFDEENVYGGCISCNYFKHGAGHEYVDWVRTKLGEGAYKKLIEKKDFYKRSGWKWDRIALIELIEKYKWPILSTKRLKLCEMFAVPHWYGLNEFSDLLNERCTGCHL